MPFNRAWEFLKAGNWYDSVDNPYGPGGVAYDGPAIDEPKPKPMMQTTRQSILPEHDLTLDETTGWEGVPPISAVRYMGDHRAGSPVPQGDYQTSFEGAPDRELGLPGRQPDVDFNAPTVDAPHGEPAPAGWKSRPPTDKDADHGYPDKGGWLYRDPDSGAQYWYKNGVKNFMGVKEGTEGSWWSYPDEENFNRAQGSAMNPSKVVALRGDPSKYGIAHLRDSDEARENLAEMFLQHNKNIPPEALVEVPMRENVPGERNEHYMDTARRMGIPRGKHPLFDGPTRWSDKPLPFGPPRTGRKLEDVPDSELYRAEPMDIAFQLLKGEERPHALMSNNDLFERINEILLYHSTDDNDDEYEELMQEAMRRREENLPEPSFGALSEPPIPFDEDFQDAHKGEPMVIAFQLLKERKSPEAWANKKRYDSEYQKTPKRVKYREQLNAERRKRGIYGKGGKDVSHTQGGKLTLESPHANRARHFKSKGTLRRVKIR